MADDLSTSYTTLAQMNYLSERESQACIVDIVNRLQPYFQIAWKKKALKIKNTTARYSVFKEHVEFVQSEADNDNDPVYGSMAQFNQNSVLQKNVSKSNSASVSGNRKFVSVNFTV